MLIKKSVIFCFAQYRLIWDKILVYLLEIFLHDFGLCRTHKIVLLPWYGIGQRKNPSDGNETEQNLSTSIYLLATRLENLSREFRAVLHISQVFTVTMYSLAYSAKNLNKYHEYLWKLKVRGNAVGTLLTEGNLRTNFAQYNFIRLPFWNTVIKLPDYKNTLKNCTGGYRFKGTVSRDFLLLFFSWISFLPAPEYSIKNVSNFAKIHEDIRKSRCATGINDTGGKFFDQFR